MSVFIHNRRLLADDLRELHAAAGRIGLPREKFVVKPSVYYSLDSVQSYMAAKKAGAVDCGRETARKLRLKLAGQVRTRRLGGESEL